MEFSAHGEFDFHIGEDYIVSRTYGAFNKEGVHALFDSTISLAQKSKLNSWHYIEIMDKDAFITPDAVGLLLAKYDDLKQAGCRCVIAVFGNWMHHQVFVDLNAKSSIPIQTAKSEEQAIEIARQ